MEGRRAQTKSRKCPREEVNYFIYNLNSIKETCFIKIQQTRIMQPVVFVPSPAILLGWLITVHLTAQKIAERGKEDPLCERERERRKRVEDRSVGYGDAHSVEICLHASSREGERKKERQREGSDDKAPRRCPALKMRQ